MNSTEVGGHFVSQNRPAPAPEPERGRDTRQSRAVDPWSCFQPGDQPGGPTIKDRGPWQSYQSIAFLPSATAKKPSVPCRASVGGRKPDWASAGREAGATATGWGCEGCGGQSRRVVRVTARTLWPATSRLAARLAVDLEDQLEKKAIHDLGGRSTAISRRLLQRPRSFRFLLPEVCRRAMLDRLQRSESIPLVMKG